MHDTELLHIVTLTAAIISLGSWPASLHSLARSRGYPFVTHLMRGLSLSHWLTALSLLIWFAPTVLSIDAILESWQLISVTTFYTLLGAKYWQTAAWAKARGRQRERYKNSIRSLSGQPAN